MSNRVEITSERMAYINNTLFEGQRVIHNAMLQKDFVQGTVGDGKISVDRYSHVHKKGDGDSNPTFHQRDYIYTDGRMTHAFYRDVAPSDDSDNFPPNAGEEIGYFCDIPTNSCGLNPEKSLLLTAALFGEAEMGVTLSAAQRKTVAIYRAGLKL